MSVRRPSLSLVLATRNHHKVREIKTLLKGLPVKIVCGPEEVRFPQVVEDGSTFAENALKKARALTAATGYAALADDSGLEVDALSGAPGIYSARFAGPGATDQANTAKLLDRMKDVPQGKRGAQFRCVAAITFPDREPVIVDEKCRGIINRTPAGRKGFGYDPVFYYPRYKKTFGQIGLAVKNRVSHRGKALRKIRERIARLLEGAGGKNNQ